jgi:hypothetical protein
MGIIDDEALKGLRFVMAVALLALFVVRFLFFGTRGLSKFIRPFTWAILLTVGLWYGREWTRPDFYRCEACGKEYTCEDEAGREPHGYCEKAVSHKHRGTVVKRYDISRGVMQTFGDTELARRISSSLGKGADSSAKPKDNG